MNRAALVAAALLISAAQRPAAEAPADLAVRSVRWTDLLPAVQRRLQQAGVDGPSFERFRSQSDAANRARVREGDLDALIYYALQSDSFTVDPRIEPAVSAKTLVDALEPATRERYLTGTTVSIARIPQDADRRLTAFLTAIQAPAEGTRLATFRDILRRENLDVRASARFIRDQYARAMRFLYLKEFVAPKQSSPADALAVLYATRGLSTDTAVEAGYLVYLGLGMVRGLTSERRIKRVLVIGPGLDLAPRTGLLEIGPPESYEPFAIIDALESLGLSTPDDLLVVGADINPRVVQHLENARRSAVPLTLVTGIGDGNGVTLDDGYRQYFEHLGARIGRQRPSPLLAPVYAGHLRKAVVISPDWSRRVRGLQLDVTTMQIDDRPFDLVIATNIFPYLDDTQLALALGNIAHTLAPGGILLHNESRPIVGLLAGEVGLPLTHSRRAVIAAVRNAPPLADNVFLHVKR